MIPSTWEIPLVLLGSGSGGWWYSFGKDLERQQSGKYVPDPLQAPAKKKKRHVEGIVRLFAPIFVPRGRPAPLRALEPRHGNF